MKILWVVNNVLPEAMSLLQGKKEVLKGSGGWLSASAKELASVNNNQLAIAAVSKKVNELTRLVGNQIEYYIIPYGKGNINLNKEYYLYWQKINEAFKPDIIHLHGTELSHGWSLFDSFPQDRIVISIQGLISQICKFYSAGIANRDIWKNITVGDLMHDIFKHKDYCGSIYYRKQGFRKRGENEKLILKKAKNVIGRTQWDRANVLAINPLLNYYVCNETLREEFYTGKWQYDKCDPCTIFLSQANFPYKGLHMIIMAMPYILKEYPNTRIIVAGADILGDNTMISKICQTGYSKYIKKLMKHNGIERNRICFTGQLDSEGMKKQFLKCNVFVSPSSIDNSPNSVCEAQMLGVPIVASFVGGVADIVSDEKCGLLYRFEDIEMLAHSIKSVFAKSPEFDSSHEIAVAQKRHDPKMNLEQLVRIYEKIVK